MRRWWNGWAANWLLLWLIFAHLHTSTSWSSKTGMGCFASNEPLFSIISVYQYHEMMEWMSSKLESDVNFCLLPCQNQNLNPPRVAWSVSHPKNHHLPSSASESWDRIWQKWGGNRAIFVKPLALSHKPPNPTHLDPHGPDDPWKNQLSR
jgi:hypothetical protein